MAAICRVKQPKQQAPRLRHLARFNYPPARPSPARVQTTAVTLTAYDNFDRLASH